MNSYHINNYLNFRGTIVRVTEAYTDAVQVEYSDGALLRIALDQLEPVTITPELLHRLGIFIDLGAFAPTFYKDSTLVVKYNTEFISVWIKGYKKEVKFIHQLQNIFQAIEEKPLLFTENLTQP